MGHNEQQDVFQWENWTNVLRIHNVCMSEDKYISNIT